MDELLDRIDPRVTEEMNEILCKEFSEKEVKEALDSIGDMKAPDRMVCMHFSIKSSGMLLGRR
jgi:hypothetical protein